MSIPHRRTTRARASSPDKSDNKRPRLSNDSAPATGNVGDPSANAVDAAASISNEQGLQTDMPSSLSSLAHLHPVSVADEILGGDRQPTSATEPLAATVSTAAGAEDGHTAFDGAPRTPSAWSVSTAADTLSDSGQVSTPSAPPELEYGEERTPAASHPSFDGVSYVPVEALKRLQDFALKSDVQTGRYSLGRIPPDSRWGTSYKTDRVLCDRENKPITVWLLCKVKSKWFFDRDGVPQPRVNISGELPYVGDYEALCKLHARVGCKNEPPTPVVYASKFQTYQVKGQNVPGVAPFTNIFDGREKFRAKKDMDSFPASSIGPGDIALLEVSLTRWKATKEAKSVKAWTDWELSFELHSVSVLFEAPPGAVVDEPAVAADVEEDM